MDEVIWVEVLSRHRDVVARYRCVGPEIRIGRGYANDVILDDPYVAPQHLRIARDETGALVAEDLGSANGLFVHRGAHRLARIVLNGDFPIRIGHTYLLIRDANHAVGPERIATSETRMWPLLLGLAGLVLGIEAISLWLNEVAEATVSRYLQPLLGVTVGALGWASAWAMISRVFSGRARFERNLLIALLGVLVYSLYDSIIEFVTFAMSWRLPAAYEYVGLWCLLGAVCFFHLRQLGPTRPVLKGGIICALVAMAIATQTLRQFEGRSTGDQQDSARRLLPPDLRLTPLQTENAFFADIEQLKSKLDRARTEDPP